MDLAKAARHGVLLVVAVGLATFVSGCGGSGSGTATDEVDTTAGNEVTVPIAAVRTELVDPGTEPRERLAPRWSPGVVQHTTLHTENGATQRIDTQPDQDFSTPPLTMPLDAATRERGIDLTIGEVTTPDAPLQQALAPTIGSHAGFTTAANGSVTALQISPAPDADDAARRAIEQTLYQAVYHTVAFPDAEIGVGAVWTIAQQISGGVTLDQVTTAKLVARRGDTLTVGIDVRQTPRSNEWNLPNGAGQLHIDHYDVHGTGTLTVDLGLPLPVDGSVTMSGDQRYRDPQGQTHLTQSTTSVVQWGR